MLRLCTHKLHLEYRIALSTDNDTIGYIYRVASQIWPFLLVRCTIRMGVAIPEDKPEVAKSWAVKNAETLHNFLPSHRENQTCESINLSSVNSELPIVHSHYKKRGDITPYIELRESQDMYSFPYRIHRGSPSP